MEDKLKNMLRLFFQSIQEYELESGNRICHDEREPMEFVEIFINSDDGFNYQELTIKTDESNQSNAN